MRPTRAPSPLLALLAALLAAPGCQAESDDALASRCLEALQIREPELASLRVVDRASPGPAVRQIRFEAQLDGLRVADTLTCRFEEDDRWSIESLALGGRPLSDGVVALVNSELLLRDLSRSPERLEDHVPAPAAPEGD